MTDMPVWFEAAANDERRKLRENPRLEVLAERADATIVAINGSSRRSRFVVGAGSGRASQPAAVYRVRRGGQRSSRNTQALVVRAS